MRSLPLVCLLLVACTPLDEDDPYVQLAATDQALASNNSALWGASGELLSGTGRLPDFSYAGYKAGEAAIPTVAQATSVKSYGAVGDGVHDDSDAIISAIAHTSSGAIYLPAGTYRITRRIELTRPNLVLRGDGPGRTVLFLPKSLGDVYGLTFNSAGQSNWSFSGGFLWIHGAVTRTTLASLTVGASRGSRPLTIPSASAASFSRGAWIRLVETDPSGELLRHVHAGLMDGGVDNVGDQVVQFEARVTAVGSTSITIDRPLPVNVDPKWSPRLERYTPAVHDVGVEHLTIRFAGTTYPGHFKEHGYNAISIDSVRDAWVRDVKIVNADLGIQLERTSFSTVEDVTLDTDYNRGSMVGHHAIVLEHAQDDLVQRFTIGKTFVHDLCVSWYARGNVFAQGSGANLNLDHHRSASYQNLFTSLHLGAGTRAFSSGGSDNRGPHSAAYQTYWNVTAASAFHVPASDFGPKLNFVGVRSVESSVSSPYSWYMDAIDPAVVQPANLYQAMVARRLGGLTSAGSWASTAIGSLTGSFTYELDAIPAATPINAVVGLAPGAAAAYADLATYIRFSPDGTIDVRSGAGFTAATQLFYTAGASYHFRLVVSTGSHTYAAYVTPPGGSERLLGSGLAFRDTQATATTLTTLAAYAVSPGAVTVRNGRVR